MKQLKQFNVFSIPVADGGADEQMDDLVDWDGGFNWASLAAGKTPTEAFTEALAYLRKAWPEAVTEKEAKAIADVFRNGNLPHETLEEVLQHWEERTNDIRQSGSEPRHGIAIEVEIEQS